MTGFGIGGLLGIALGASAVWAGSAADGLWQVPFFIGIFLIVAGFAVFAASGE